MKKERNLSECLRVITIAFLVCLIIPFSLSEIVVARPFEAIFAEVATDITKNCIFNVSENEVDIKKLTDSSISTNWSASEDAFIEISSTQNIGAIYIEWTSLPEIWTLSIFDESIFVPYKKSGDDVFINEFISIEESYKKIRISWNKTDKPVSIARITVFTKGDVPDNIQKWEPPCTKADMLVLPTHADDEHLYFGGTLSTYAGEQRKKVQVAYMTNCGFSRTREALAGLWVSGIKNYPIISNFPDRYAATYDEAVKIYGLDPVLEYQVMLLRRFQPDVVIGHDLLGEYGHGAHMLNAKSLTRALEVAKDSLMFVESAEKYGIWEVKKCYLHLYKENPITMDWTLPLESFGGKSSWEIAQTGYLKHVSQQRFKFIVRIEGPNDCRQFGLYFTSVGEDILKNDFFENVSPILDSQTNSNTVSEEIITSAISNTSSAESSSGLSSPIPNSLSGINTYWVKNAVIISFIVIILLLLLFYILYINRKHYAKK